LLEPGSPTVVASATQILMSIRLRLLFGLAVAAQILKADPADDAYIRQKLVEAICSGPRT